MKNNSVTNSVMLEYTKTLDIHKNRSLNKDLNVGFVGNPNCGKTTLFNAYTGAKLKVANWPGVTVEKKEGSFRFQNHRFKLVDLPGIYSLTSYTMEEKLTRQFILDNEVDVIVNVADASSLERNIYLTLQLIELGKPVILALNMMDIVIERGMEIDVKTLSHLLGIPVVPVSARKKTGLDLLMQTVTELGFSELRKQSETSVKYNQDLEFKISELTNQLLHKYPEVMNARWYAIKMLEWDTEIMKSYPLKLSGMVDRSFETDIINQKYDFIEEIIGKVMVNKSKKVQSTDKIDRLLTNKYLGMPIFFFIMALVFFMTFTIGDALKGVFEIVLASFSDITLNFLVNIGTGEVMTSLIVDGIIAGVGGILTFLPNIFILFMALAFLEDSGYMSRVAYVMNGLMGKIGLSGRAFIPMLLGFGCTVPAVMASRTLENVKDRRRTIMITPFMSCSAKIPIYVLFSSMFFGKYGALAAFSMYVLGLFVGIITAYIMHNIDNRKGLKEMNALLIELPEYKAPNVRSIIIYVWDKVKDYLTKAGTTIFLASVILWFVLNFGSKGMVTDVSESFGASFGNLLEPILKPAGLGYWQIGVALISGVSAKEVVVSSFGVLFGIININSETGMNNLVAILKPLGFGALNAYALMVFCLLYTPCAAAVGVIARELKSLKWTIFTIIFQLVIAWVAATIVFQVGSLFI